jgi:hypothetical protein
MEGHIQIKEILNQIVGDFLSMMARMAAAKLFGSIFGGLFSGGNPVMAASVGGANPYGATSMAASVGSTHVHFHGPVLAQEEYVVSTIAPIIERAVRSGRSRLVIR